MAFRITWFLWLLFSPIAAVLAYLITFDEYRKHFPDRRRAVRESLRSAGVTLLFFLVLGAVLSPLLARLGR